MKLTINLATRRYINLRAVNLSLVVALLIMAGLLILRVRELAYNQAELERVRSLTRQSEERGSKTPQVSEAQLKALGPQIAFANQLIDRKSLDWLGLLDRLEEVVPDGVALTALEPSQHEQLKLTGVARDFGNLRAFLEKLEGSRNFSDVYLLTQSETKVGKTQHGIIFSLTCKAAYR